MFGILVGVVLFIQHPGPPTAELIPVPFGSFAVGGALIERGECPLQLVTLIIGFARGDNIDEIVSHDSSFLLSKRTPARRRGSSSGRCLAREGN
jgi:hypothetical protein